MPSGTDLGLAQAERFVCPLFHLEPVRQAPYHRHQWQVQFRSCSRRRHEAAQSV